MSSIHPDPHPLSGKSVVVKRGHFAGRTYHVEDYWDCVAGYSWSKMLSLPSCLNYMIRRMSEYLPGDDEVLYGKIDGLGHLIHVTELEEDNG